MRKKFKGLSWYLFSCASVAVLAIAVMTAGAQSLCNFHEPKVPEKLRRNL